MKQAHCKTFNRIVFLLIGIIFTWGFSYLFSASVEAQNFKSAVVLDDIQLPETKKERLEGLDETIREYIDNSQWFDNPLNFEVPITLTLSLRDISAQHEDRYEAQLKASNNRDIHYQDRFCKFPYQMNEPLFRDDNTYDPLTGFIDFYIYMIVAGEMDKRALLGGTSFYEKALKVCENATFGESIFHKGWDERTDLVERMLDEEMETIRKLQTIFFRAKVYHQEGNSSKARRYCRAVVIELGKMFDEDSNDERVKEFLKYRYFDFGPLFEEDKDPTLFQRLVELDPDHREEYEKYIN